MKELYFSTSIVCADMDSLLQSVIVFRICDVCRLWLHGTAAMQMLGKQASTRSTMFQGRYQRLPLLASHGHPGCGLLSLLKPGYYSEIMV
jgi:hypothetical protein